MSFKYGPLFGNQSNCDKSVTEINNDNTETKNEHEMHQTQTNRILENKFEHNEKPIPSHSNVSTLNASRHSPKIMQKQTMIRETIYHQGTTREIMAITYHRNNSSESRRLVEQRNALKSRSGTLRCQYNPQTERTVFAPSCPYTRSREG